MNAGNRNYSNCSSAGVLHQIWWWEWILSNVSHPTRSSRIRKLLHHSSLTFIRHNIHQIPSSPKQISSRASAVSSFDEGKQVILKTKFWFKKIRLDILIWKNSNWVWKSSQLGYFTSTQNNVSMLIHYSYANMHCYHIWNYKHDASWGNLKWIEQSRKVLWHHHAWPPDSWSDRTDCENQCSNIWRWRI